MPSLTNFWRAFFDGLWDRLRSASTGSNWRAAAEASGLTSIREAFFFWKTTSVEGWLEALHVDLRTPPGRRNAGDVVRITVNGLTRELSMSTEGLGSRLQKRLGLAADIETGDASFDRDFLIQGRPPLVRALLDTDTRTAVRRVFSAGGVAGLAAGELRIDVTEGDGQPFLHEVLRPILALAQRLVEPADIAAQLRRNGLEDREQGVRQRCLIALMEAHPADAATTDTLRRACSDASEDVRLTAALALGDEGHPVLRALASAAEGEACAARAIAALGTSLEPQDALAWLEASLEKRRHTVAVACIGTLGARGLDGPAAGVETVLIERCVTHSDETVRMATAEALGRVGSVAAVLPLQEAARQAGGSQRRALLSAAQAIQSRLSGAEAGQLTVSNAEGGTVTLASEGGQVSLPDTDGPRSRSG